MRTDLLIVAEGDTFIIFYSLFFILSSFSGRRTKQRKGTPINTLTEVPKTSLFQVRPR